MAYKVKRNNGELTVSMGFLQRKNTLPDCFVADAPRSDILTGAQRFSLRTLIIPLLVFFVSCGGGAEVVRVESTQPHLTRDKDELNRLLGLGQKRDSVVVRQTKTVEDTDTELTVTERDSLVRLINLLRDDLLAVKRIAEQQAILIDSLSGELAAVSSKTVQAISKSEEPRKEDGLPKKTVVQASKPTVDPVKKKYDDALAVMKKKKYKTASTAFEKILADHPGHDLAAAAQYQLAECYFLMLDFSQALVDFQKALTFSGAAADAIQLKIGLCYYRMQNASRAREAFEKLVAQFPKSAHTKTAKEYLAKL
jgi:TolA-binding protein